jgi:alpha-glucosidase (family GH31 glycosyl hydrolase)
MRLVLILAALRWCLADVDASGPSEVTVGDLRVQALSANLVRVEPKGPKGFEDRTTFMVTKRDFTGLPITKTETDEGTLLATSAYKILIRSKGGMAPGGTCSNPLKSDVTGAVRSAKFPDGAKGISSASACCNACGSDSTCIAWVFVESYSGCYPLASYTSPVSSSGHDFGAAPSSCSATSSSDVTGAERSPKFPDGAKDVGSASACCDACRSDPGCNAYVFIDSFKGCYPLAGYTGVVSSEGHTFGTMGSSGGFKVTSTQGDVTIFDSNHDARSNQLFWPSPMSQKGYGILDQPRFFVPEWGCAPIPSGATVSPSLRDSNGYDWGNQVAGDTYVFVLGSDISTYNAARKDFIELTGPTPVLPDYAYGTWFTFWHNYNFDEAKDDISHWETLQLPLDVWGLDINWRGVTYPDHMQEPNQCDYDHPQAWINDDWFQYLKQQKLRTYHNDHPCAQGPQAGPKEVDYRYSGLTKWLAKGLTFWWFDMNWGWTIPPPFRSSGDWEGLDTPVWGSHVFFTVTSWYNEHVRKPKGDDWYGAPIALSKSMNDNWEPGMDPARAAEHPAHHRYPVHWTGDYVTLQASVESMVDGGLHSFKPYVHSDCGGDYGQKLPNPDDVTSAGGLLRWTGHCAYGSILRFHGADHRVWHYDQNTQNAFRNYLTARHKLIPTIKSAAQKATETGHPLVARLDLFWPEHKDSGSASHHQYMFLDDILVAPIFESKITTRQVWIPPGDWQDAWDPSSLVTGPKMMTVHQPADKIPMWHKRDGGLFILAHKPSTRVETQDWSSLSVEAFPSSSACNSSRRLFEKRESPGWTDINMDTDGDGGLRMQISAGPVSRSWVVRLNLRPKQRLISAMVDGVMVSSVFDLHLEPSGSDEYFPLMGAGSMPPKGAGAVAEIHLSPSSHARSIEATIDSPVSVIV